jgi:hypothetical protein
VPSHRDGNSRRAANREDEAAKSGAHWREDSKRRLSEATATDASDGTNQEVGGMENGRMIDVVKLRADLRELLKNENAAWAVTVSAVSAAALLDALDAVEREAANHSETAKQLFATLGKLREASAALDKAFREREAVESRLATAERTIVEAEALAVRMERERDEHRQMWTDCAEQMDALRQGVDYHKTQEAMQRTNDAIARAEKAERERDEARAASATAREALLDAAAKLEAHTQRTRIIYAKMNGKPVSPCDSAEFIRALIEKDRTS